MPFTDEFWKTQKIRILKKWKRNCGRYHHFTHVYQIPQSYEAQFLRYEEWKMKISKKLKKPLEIPSFYIIVPKIMTIGYTVPEVWHVIDVIVVFHFGLFFALYPSKSPKKKVSKKMKKHLEISSFYTGVPKIMIRWWTVSNIWCMADGWTDGRTETQLFSRYTTIWYLYQQNQTDKYKNHLENQYIYKVKNSDCSWMQPIENITWI